MIKTAAKKPQERSAFVEKAVNEQAQFPNDPVARAFGLKINPRMMEVPSMLPPLPPPPLSGASAAICAKGTIGSGFCSSSA